MATTIELKEFDLDELISVLQEVRAQHNGNMEIYSTERCQLQAVTVFASSKQKPALELVFY